MARARGNVIRLDDHRPPRRSPRAAMVLAAGLIFLSAAAVAWTAALFYLIVLR